VFLSSGSSATKHTPNNSVIICVVFFDAYMRCTRLCLLNPGVTQTEINTSKETLERGKRANKSNKN
jgi:hypothetical protein